MSLGLLARQPVTWDSEAAAYILQVEAADGQSLESGVARAINTFVIDCKVRGIWGAIKSCCLLSGARTLNGALRPLKGTAPTNFNFTNSDYNRETGLKGDGSSKYINTNISATSPLVGQDNLHFSTYITATNSTAALRSYIADGGRNMYRTISSAATQFNINASFGSSGGDSAMVASTGFCGLSRNNGQNFTIRVIGSNRVYSAASIAESGYLGGTFRIFGRNGNLVMQEFSDGRISFYSIGEAVNLRLLDQCVSSLRQNFLRATSIYSITDTDALNYIRRIESADGFILENSVKQAIDNLVIGLKSDSLWSSIKTCCLLSGAKTLAGALTPLVGPAPQSFFFTDSHYNRSLGLVGVFDSFRYINSRRTGDSDPQNNHHMCVYRTTSNNINIFIGSTTLGNSFSGDVVGSSGQNPSVLWSKSRTLNSVTTSNYNSGSNVLIGIARNNADNYEIIGNNLTTTINAASNTPSSNNIYIFSGANTSNQGGGINSNTDARIAYYSIGEYLNLSLLDARLDTFMAALSNAGI